MRIITFKVHGDDHLWAMTQEEFDKAFPDLMDFDYTEFVWQDADDKSQALRCHRLKLELYTHLTAPEGSFAATPLRVH